MKKTTAVIAAAALSLSLGAAMTQPAQAGDCLSTPVTYNPKPDISKFKQRINHIKKQTENAESKGWISSEQAAKFKGDYERLAQMEQSAGPKASKEKKDSLEKDLTKVHQELHSAIADSKTM
jgi:microcompartment protein CcmL/EutN